MKISLKVAAKRLQKADNILILAHRRPDGDTIGTAFGLHYALEQLGKTSRVECADPFPEKFEYFYNNYTPIDFTPDFIVTVDVANPILLGSLNKEYGDKTDLAIDHHKSNSMYATETLLDATAPATTEILYLLLEHMGVSLTVPMANALFTGLVTDTGGLRFASVTPRTYRVAADLIEGGADHIMINKALFESASIGRLKVEAYAIDHLEFFKDGKIAFLYLPENIKEKHDILEEELDGISSLTRTVKGATIGVTLRDLGTDVFRVSLRTENPYDASRICEKFDGGGHVNAAGCTIRMPYLEAKEALLQEIYSLIELVENK